MARSNNETLRPGRLAGLVLAAGLAALFVLGGCAHPPAKDREAAATDDAAATADPIVTPVSAQILAAARTPVSYDSRTEYADPGTGAAQWRLTHPGSDSPPVRLTDAAGPTPPAGPADAVAGTVVAVSPAGSAQRSMSRMGLLTMRKIVVPENPTRRPVRDRDRDRRDAPSDRRGDSGRSPSPEPIRNAR